MAKSSDIKEEIEIKKTEQEKEITSDSIPNAQASGDGAIGRSEEAIENKEELKKEELKKRDEHY